MKQKIISVLSVLIVLVLIFISMKYFRNGNPFVKRPQIEAETETDGSKQDGEIDEKSKAFAKKVEEAMDNKYTIDPENVVPMGKTMKEGPLRYKVLSWEITKQKPDYPYPSGDSFSPSEETMADACSFSACSQ